MTVGSTIGKGFSVVRDAIAAALVRIGANPNTLTISGTVITMLAAICLALGAGAGSAWSLRPGELRQYQPNAYLLLAGALMVLCCAGDMLDGAVARIGRKSTTFGAFLDSTLDRFSDFAIFLGIGFYFVLRGNVTNTLLPVLAMFAGLMISYTRARAEDLIQFCTVGYWQRGERMVAVIIAIFAGNIPALLWQQALLPMFTVWARIRYTAAVAGGKQPQIDPRKGTGLDTLKLWRYPRMSWQYDVVTGLNILWLILADIPPNWDPISRLLGV
jgi:CDP-diacylglycerol--glycerol-3-phosphate 3-phosphatidyltransferase